MSTVQEATGLVRRAAEPRPVGDSVKQAIIRAARRLQWSITRTKKVWYGEAARIDANEMDALRLFAAEQADRYSRVAAAMQAVDPDFYAEEINSLVHASRLLGGKAAPDT